MALGLEFCDWLARRFSVEAIGISEALFPRPLSTYGDPQIGSLMEVLAGRISSEPLNLVATIIFLLAIIHNFHQYLCWNLDSHWYCKSSLEC